MYRDDLFYRAVETDDEDERMQLAGEVFFANMGITVRLMDQYHVAQDFKEDFMQIAFFAMLKSIHSYNPNSGYSPLSYYRMCIKHESYLRWIQNKRFQTAYIDESNTNKKNFIIYNKVYQVESGVERLFMNKYLWEQISTVLTGHDAKIVKLKYYDNWTLKQIGMKFNVTAESVRQKLQKCYRILRADPGIIEVALYYGYSAKIINDK